MVEHLMMVCALFIFVNFYVSKILFFLYMLVSAAVLLQDGIGMEVGCTGDCATQLIVKYVASSCNFQFNTTNHARTPI
jgi:hypothetical protein